MAASVGGVSCTFVRGTIPPVRETVSIFKVPGQDGYGRQNLGKSTGEFTVVAELLGTQAAIDTWIAAICALKGNAAQITITNDLGQTSANCAIAEVGQPRVVPARNDAQGYEVKCFIPLECIREA